MSSEECLEDKSWNQLLAASELQIFRNGDVIIEEGDSFHHVYRIKKGQVEVIRERHTVAVLTEGQLFGEMEVLDHVRITQPSRESD